MPWPKWNAKSSPCGETISNAADGAPSVGNSTPGAVPMRTNGLSFSFFMRATADVMVTIAASRPPNAMKSKLVDNMRGRTE